MANNDIKAPFKGAGTIANIILIVGLAGICYLLIATSKPLGTALEQILE